LSTYFAIFVLIWPLLLYNGIFIDGVFMAPLYTISVVA